MMMAEFIALVAVLSGGGIGIRMLVSWFKRLDKQDAMKEEQRKTMQKDLREALQSGDWRKLDDFVVIWDAYLDKQVRDHIQNRRNELYIEDDNRKKEDKFNERPRPARR